MPRIARFGYGFFTFVRFGSMPVTVAPVVLGYLTVAGTVMRADVLPLVATAVFGHWAAYGGFNDVFDLEWDRRQGRTDRPLVAGYLSYRTGLAIATTSLCLTTLLAVAWFPPAAAATWVLVAGGAGLTYDARSKTDTYACVYLATWGAGTVLAGALYAGDPTPVSVVLAGTTGLSMLWMTMTANLRDLDNGEASIPRRLGCEVVRDGGQAYLSPSDRYRRLNRAVVGATILVTLLLPVAAGIDATTGWLYAGALPAAYAVDRTGARLVRRRPVGVVETNKDVVIHMSAGTVLTVLAALSFADATSLLVVGAATAAFSAAWWLVHERLSTVADG